MLSFRRNLSSIDQLVRLLVGVACVYIGFIDAEIVGNELISILIGSFGVINIFAALFSYCPVYAACGVNTYVAKSQE